MSRLTIYRDDAPAETLLDTADGAAIAEALNAIGVRFERWPLAEIDAGADDAAVIAAYAPQIERLKAAGGYQANDIVRLGPDAPNRDELRAKFLSEHRHGEDEVRFFVEGSGMFYLREDGRVHMLLCEAGDLISVPAGIRHWFDMGPRPSFAAIRLFTNIEGWVARFTGDAIADVFPRYEPQPA